MEKNMKNTVKFLSGLALLVLASQAAAVPSGPDSDPTGCALSDLTTSTACVGVYDPGNDNGQASIFPTDTFQNVFPGAWTELTKVEDDNSWIDPTSLGLTVAPGGGTSGTWSVNSDAWNGFVQGEVLAILKAGDSAAAYEIDLSVTSGEWDVTSDAWKDDKSGNVAGLSHFSFWTTSTNDVPEPSILALLSLGVFGLVLSARCNRKM